MPSKKPKSTIIEFKQTSFENKKAGIYVRVSRNEFQKGKNGEKEMRQSVKSQEATAIDYCKNKKWDYILYKKDCDLSGHLKAGEMGRKNLGKLYDDIKKGLIHTVIVRESKRLYRNNYYLKGMVYEVLLPWGVNLIGTDRPIDITTQRGRMFLSIEGEFAESDWHETRLLSMKNREAKAKEGTLALNPYTFGFKSIGKNSVKKVPKEAEIAKKIFEWFCNGLTFKEIKQKLNANNMPTKYGKKWETCQISRLLQNPRYIGKISYNKKACNSPCPPIIDTDTWNTAHEILKTNKKKRAQRSKTNSKYLLSGILQCSGCIEREKKNQKAHPHMTVHRTPSLIKNKTLFYYTCQDNRKYAPKICKGSSVRLDEIETFTKELIGAFATENYLNTTSTLLSGKDDMIKSSTAIEEKLIKLKKKKNSLVDKFDEKTNTTNYILTLNSIDKKIDTCETELSKTKSELTEIEQATQLEEFNRLKEWDKLSLSDKRKALSKVIPKMVLFDNQLEVYLGHKTNNPIIVSRQTKLLKGFKGEKQGHRTKRKYLPSIPDKFFTVLTNKESFEKWKIIMNQEISGVASNPLIKIRHCNPPKKSKRK